MTAEVIVMNPEAVVVASDSALTVGNRRVWEHGNKVFSMGPEVSLGIMYYNVASFRGIPLETAIKDFRQKHTQLFETVEAFSEAFLGYLGKLSSHHSNDLQTLVSMTFEFIELFSEWSKDDEGNDVISRESLRRNVPDELERIDFSSKKLSFTDEQIRHFNAVLKDKIEDSCDVIVEDDVNFYDFACDMLELKYTTENHTGLVFFGFGENELFPSLRSFTVDGDFNGEVRMWVGAEHNLNSADSPSASILSFAQSDMANMFMQGISSEILHSYYAELDNTLNEETAQSIKNKFKKISRSVSVDPIMRSIQSLPKEEMAIVAESLVGLTVLRRKIDSDVRSVGGPVDLACISKGDGFIWLKRKHYFKPDINTDFLQRKKISKGD